MAGAIAKLVVALGANISEFETDMKRASRNQDKRMRQMRAQAVATGKAMGAAFAAIGGTMGVLVSQTTKTADQMAKLSQRLGASTEALSELQYVAEQSGVDFRTLEMGLQRMTRRIGEVAFLGKGEAKQALQILGLEARKLAELPLDKQFEAIAEELSQIGNVSQRTSLAMKIFDAEGVKLVQLMGEGAEGIQELRGELERTGAVISQELADASAQFNNNLSTMGKYAEGARNQLVEGLLPSLISLQEAFLDGASNSDIFRAAGEQMGKLIQRLAAGFRLLWGLLQTIAAAILGLANVVIGFVQAVSAPLTAFIKGIGSALDALRQGKFKEAAQAVGNIGKRIGDEFANGLDNIKTGVDEVIGSVVYFEEGMEDAADIMQQAVIESGKLGRAANDVADGFDSAADSASDAGKAIAGSTKQLDRFSDSAKDVNDFLDEMIDLHERLNEEQEAYERALRDVLDRLYPVEAAGRELGNTLAILTRALNDGTLSWEQYQDAVNRAVAGFEQAAGGMRQVEQGLDTMAVAIDEGIRILERVFQDVFESIINQSDDAWDAIRRGFESLVASIARNPIRIVIDQVQKAFGPGGGGFGSLDWGKLGGDVARAAGNIIGLSMADSIWGQAGSVLGGIAGEALATTFLTALGSFAGPIGAFIGSILGSVVGDWIGDLFSDDSFNVRLGGANAPGAADAYGSFKTPLGEVFGISSKNLGHFNEMEKAGGQLAKAITDFDTAIFDMLQALGGQDIITEIQGILANWTGFWEEGALTVENILGSRWQAILGAFEDDVRAFVKNGADLEEEVQRLGAALTLQKFTDENPEVFAGRELAEILAVVEAFKAAGGTMEQALQRFVQTADAVISLTTALRDFAGSDLRTDFYNLINPLSLEQSLSVVRNALRDAVADFDGSIESLQTIGELSMVVRRGELELLQQIDAIQKGLNANLDKLKADILGIGAEPKSTEEIFQDAKRLIRDVRRATSAQDVARVGQEFEALIRQIPEADILAIGPALVASLVTQFQYAATRQLSAFKESTIGEGEELRATLDTFLAGIGDPLQIIADSLEGDSLPEVMDEGLSEINATVSTIGPQVASAIQQSLGNVNVTVVVQDAGLVTQ